jgi:transmembrane 9 superfamily protein 2/4
MKIPRWPTLITFILGTGAQVLVSLVVFLLSMSVGMIHESVRVAWFASLLIIFAGAGWFNGYVTSRAMKTMGTTDWTGGVTISAFIYPTVVMICLVVIDLIEWIEKSAAGMPLTSVFIYGAVWTTMSITMCYHGATVGYRADPYLSLPCKQVAMPRKVPAQPWYVSMKLLMPCFGAIIFASIFVEFTYLWNSIWRSQLYQMFGFLFAVLLILIFVVSELAIVQTYWSLQA